MRANIPPSEVIRQEISKVVYLFLDATYLPVRRGTEEKEGILCAYGLTEEGWTVFIHLTLGSRKGYDSWISFLHDMTSRGLNAPFINNLGRPVHR